MDIYLLSRRLAMAAVLSPDEGFRLRQIFRWYSKEYHTSLIDTEKLPLLHVLQAFYESHYELMLTNAEENPEKEDIFKKELISLYESKEERFARVLEEESTRISDELFAKMVEEEEKADEIRRLEKANKIKALADRELSDLSKPMSGPLGGLLEKTTKSIKQLSKALKEESYLPKEPTKEELPQDVKISFIDPDEFEKELNYIEEDKD